MSRLIKGRHNRVVQEFARRLFWVDIFTIHVHPEEMERLRLVFYAIESDKPLYSN